MCTSENNVPTTCVPALHRRGRQQGCGTLTCSVKGVTLGGPRPQEDSSAKGRREGLEGAEWRKRRQQTGDFMGFSQKVIKTGTGP